jgi:hypothetical protein
MKTARTKFLALIAVLTGLGALWACAIEGKARSHAIDTQRDASITDRELAAIVAARASDAQVLAGGLDAVELTRHLISAAVTAGVVDRLVDKDSIPPARLENTDYEELQLTLAFQRITIRELTGFFQQLAAADPRSRVKLIELSPPESSGRITADASSAAGENADEKWTANIAVAYLRYAPRQTPSR